MSKLILSLTISALAVTTNGKIKLQLPITGIEQKEAAVLKGMINVPYILYNGGKGSLYDDIDSSKIDFSKQFLILARGEVPGTGARLQVKSLVLKDKILTLTYKLGVAGKAVAPGSPNVFFFAVIVDKKYQAGIKLLEL